MVYDVVKSDAAPFTYYLKFHERHHWRWKTAQCGDLFLYQALEDLGMMEEYRANRHALRLFCSLTGFCQKCRRIRHIILCWKEWKKSNGPTHERYQG